MAIGRARKCRFCGKSFGPEANAKRRFCDANCRQASYRKVKKQQATYTPDRIPEHVRDMVQLAFGADSNDIIREILREEIRENVTQAVRDNVLGAAEVMTRMLPKCLEALNKDLESGDWVVRSRAQALLLKYAMSFSNKEGEDKDLGKLTLVHHVPVPETPLGERMVEEAEAADQRQLESWEKGWPVCDVCGERKHPDSMYSRSKGFGQPRRIVCKSCSMLNDIERRKVFEPNLDTTGPYIDD